MALTLCARWLRFLNQKDPGLRRDVPGVLQEFGDQEGYTVAELDERFREEETLEKRARAAQVGKKLGP